MKPTPISEIHISAQKDKGPVKTGEWEKIMSKLVCGGASLRCSFGTAPGILLVLSAANVMTSQMLASIMDQIPLVNIMPFGMCTSMANPTVAAATAALGVLTPMPCIPNTTSPWMPGDPRIMIGNHPALTDNSRLMCAWGGDISIDFPGTANIIPG